MFNWYVSKLDMLARFVIIRIKARGDDVDQNILINVW
jgi:hypothetical protein